MKKLFIVSIAVVMCLALAFPAAAAVKMSGGVHFLAYIWNGSDETSYNSQPLAAFSIPGFAVQGTSSELSTYGPLEGANDRSNLQMNLSNLLTNIRATYVNSKGTYGATLGIVGGQINNYSTFRETSLTSTYLWWKIMPNVKVTIGKISQFIGGLGPSSVIEHSEYERAANTYSYNAMGSGDSTGVYPYPILATPVAGLTSYGNISTTSIPGIAIDIKVNDMISVIFGLYDPDADGTPNITLRPAIVGGATQTIEESTKIPRLDIAIPIKWGNFYVQPVASYTKQTFNGVLATCPDENKIWLVGGSASVTFGPVTVGGEFIKGENIGDGNYSGPGSTSSTGTPAVYLVTGFSNTWEIGDIEDTAWNIWARWQATPKIRVQGGYGQWVGEGDHNPTITSDDRYYKRSGYVFNIWYAVGPNFFIIPSYAHLEMGQDVRMGHLASLGWASDTLVWSFGDVDLYGVGFYMIF
jgi:hypothetical protein